MPVVVLTVTAPQPAIGFAPSSNAIVPPSGAGVTFARSVTGLVFSAGLADVVSVVVVPWLTTWESVPEVLARKKLWPPYAAVSACVPIVANVVKQVAVPVVASTGAAAQPEIVEAPSLNATVPPSGTGATVAVRTRASVVSAGFVDEARVVEVEVVTV